MNDRIPAGTKCIIKSVPADTSIYSDLTGAACVASEKNTEGGSRGTGTQLFDMMGKTGNGDSGFIVEAVKD